MKFRFHRETLEEAMETVVNVNSLEALKKIVHENYPQWKDKELTFKYSCYDPRVKWRTYYVCLGGACIGMSNTNKFKKEK